MQPYVILKRPGKAILYLFVIMLLFIVKDSYGHGCTRACSGPVLKVRIYSEIAKAFVQVVGNSVMATNLNNNGTIYKISKGENFYLYDANAAKFICWNNKRNRKATLVARKYKPKHLELCEFKDLVSTSHRSSHVYLVTKHNISNDTLMMRFSRNGRPCPHRARHQRKKCVPDVMVISVGEQQSDGSCRCPDFRRRICQTELRKMTELREICNPWPRSNETYET